MPRHERNASILYFYVNAKEWSARCPACDFRSSFHRSKQKAIDEVRSHIDDTCQTQEAVSDEALPVRWMAQSLDEFLEDDSRRTASRIATSDGQRASDPSRSG